ncbi:MAG: HD domain-containing protein [Clostridiales bacterium]|nr:HD domain-containing protein [Clostridiales bacterium]
MPSTDIKNRYIVPEKLQKLLECLESHGFEAYIVGGAVRDIFLGKEPYDFDVATSAEPEEVMSVFGKENCHPTGLSHGTVTVVWESVPIEVTTFRIDGEYLDARHPQEVLFTRNLEEDVKRRDFTINALALSKDSVLVDHCGGREDLEKGLIRAVGDPKIRFEEDALRILRALRFASQLGFSIEEETEKQIFLKKDSLSRLSVERVWQELSKLFCGKFATDILRRYIDVIAVVIPEIVPMKGCNQYNPHHIYDVWEHSLVAMENVPGDLILRVTMLLHDVAKPQCFQRGEDGIGHFYGHQKKGADMADAILRRLKVDTKTRETIVTLIKIHDVALEPSLHIVRRRLNQYGEDILRKLIQVKRADIKAHSELSSYRFPEIDRFEEMVDSVIKESLCFSYADMQVSGKDLIGLGIPSGPVLGEIKKQLLDEIIEETVPNEKEALLLRAQSIWEKRDTH